MDAKREYADAVDRFVELLQGFVATNHPHTTARSHMFVESPRNPGSAITGEKLGPIKPVIVHDSRAINDARKAIITAAIAAGEPLKSLLVTFTKTGDGWSSARSLLSEADAASFERDLAPYEEALYAALGKQLTAGTSSAAVSVLRSDPTPNLALTSDDGEVRTGPPEGEVKRAVDELLRFFAERGRELGRGSWEVTSDGEPEHDLYYA
jgi:hypothetical protein